MYFGMKKAFSSISVISEETSENEKSVNFNIEYRNTHLKFNLKGAMAT